MNYRVFWAPYAEERLERIIVASPHDRTVVVAAAREIDRILLAQPREFGESREDSVRIGFVHPLGVDFDVMDDVATVLVYNVWRNNASPGRRT